MSNDITIRFNFGRQVAVFDSKEEMDAWVKNCDLYQEFMYTIHGAGEVNLEKYKKTL